MIFSWANKQLEKLSETMAPLSNSATNQFIQALQNNDIQTAKSLLSTDNQASQGFNNSAYGNAGASYHGGYNNNNNGNRSNPLGEPQMTFVNPHSTTFHPHKQTKAIHITCQYSNTLVYNYILSTFYSNDPAQVLLQSDAVGNTVLHYACLSTSHNALSFVQFLIEAYKTYNVQQGISQKNHSGQTAYDISSNDLIRQYLLPIQLQFETQECLNNGGVGLPQGIDLGGLKIQNRNLAPPPTIGSGGSGNMYSMQSGQKNISPTSRYAIPNELKVTPTSSSMPPTMATTHPSNGFNQPPSPYTNQYSTFTPSATDMKTLSTTTTTITNNITSTDNKTTTITVSDQKTNSMSLPNGWVELVDPTSNRPYYYNQVLNLTQWELPVETNNDKDISSNEKEAVMNESANDDLLDTTKNETNQTISNEIDNDITASAEEIEKEEDVKSKEKEAMLTESTNEDVLVTSKNETNQMTCDEIFNDVIASAEETQKEEVSIDIQKLNINNEPDNLVCEVNDGVETNDDQKGNDTANILNGAKNSADLINENETTIPEKDVNSSVNDDDNDTAPKETEETMDNNETKVGSNELKQDELASQEIQGELKTRTSELPSGWSELFDESSGRSYFYNEQTNATQWERPSTVDAAVASNAFNENSNLDHQVLPQGWTVLQDPSTGHPYYFNQQLNLTQWEKPKASPSATTHYNKSAKQIRKVPTGKSSNGKKSESNALSLKIYARRGYSTAAVLPSNSKYKPDGFHSSSSDKKLQEKYGHDASITGPPSGMGYSGNSTAAPPTFTGSNNGNLSLGQNPYARGNVMARPQYPNTSCNGSYGTYNSTGYQSSHNAPTAVDVSSAQYSTQNAYSNYNQQNQYVGTNANLANYDQKNIGQWNEKGYQQTQDTTIVQNSPLNEQQHQEIQAHHADENVTSTRDIVPDQDTTVSNDIGSASDLFGSPSKALDKPLVSEQIMNNTEKKRVEQTHFMSTVSDTPSSAGQLFQSSIVKSANQESVPPSIHHNQSSTTVAGKDSSSHENIDQNGIQDTSNFVAESSLSTNEHQCDVDDILPPPPMISEGNNAVTRNEKDNVLSPPTAMSEEFPNNEQGSEFLPPPPEIGLGSRNDDEIINVVDTVVGSSENDTDDLLPPPPMMDIALDQ